LKIVRSLPRSTKIGDTVSDEPINRVQHLTYNRKLQTESQICKSLQGNKQELNCLIWQGVGFEVCCRHKVSG